MANYVEWKGGGSMNKTKFNKVLSLYKEGVPPHTCVLVILQMSLPNQNPDITLLRETATWIDKFYTESATREITNVNP